MAALPRHVRREEEGHFQCHLVLRSDPQMHLKRSLEASGKCPALSMWAASLSPALCTRSLGLPYSRSLGHITPAFVTQECQTGPIHKPTKDFKGLGRGPHPCTSVQTLFLLPQATSQLTDLLLYRNPPEHGGRWTRRWHDPHLTGREQEKQRSEGSPQSLPY